MASSVDADQTLNDPRFSRSFEIPANTLPGHDGPFKVTYADFGYRNETHPESEKVMFFFGGLFASRWLQVTKDEAARRESIRVISIDRPGFGGTDVVPNEERLDLSRALVLALLKHLDIKTITIACHSGGTVYALDLLLHHPELLDPQSPYIAIAGPWIHPSHTGVMTLSMAEALPRGLVGHFDKVVGFFHNVAAAPESMSFGVSNPLAKLFSTPLSGGLDGVEAKTEEDMLPKFMNRAHAEDTRGLSSEALLLLRRIESSNGWGDWGDADELVRRVATAFRDAGRTLKVDVFYAATDSMIGDAAGKGPKWFDDCWRSGGDAIEYSREVVEGADHDTVWHLRWGVPQKVYARMRGTDSH